MPSRNHLFPSPKLASSITCACSVLFSHFAYADMSDTIKPYVQTSINYDDNLLRLQDGTSNGGERGDTYKTVTGGVYLDKYTIGQQVISGQALFSRVNFNHFTQLDYTSKDLELAMNWHVLKHLSGDVGVIYNQTLAPYTDFHSDERNLRTDRKVYGDANWQFHPSWQVHGAASREKFDYELLAQRFNTRTEDSAELGGDFLPASGSRFGLLARRTKGSYPNLLTLGSLVYDNRYVQDEVKANVYWIVSGHTRLQFLGGWERRNHPSLERSDSGKNGRMIVTWTPTGKLNVVGSAWREFSAFEGGTLTSSLNKGASVKAVWSATSKLSANLLLKQEKRNFDTNNTRYAGIVLDDQTHSTQLGVTYAPLARLQISLTAFRDRRSGSQRAIINGYTANGGSLNAAVQF